MLQKILDLFNQSDNAVLSVESISRQLGIAPAVVEQMLHTLVSRGKLTQVDPATLSPVRGVPLPQSLPRRPACDPAGVFATGIEQK